MRLLYRLFALLLLPHSIAGDVFTGPGSFYDFSKARVNDIGRRAVYDPAKDIIFHSRDYVEAISSADQKSLILQKSTKWLLVGDSTERYAILDFCSKIQSMARKSEEEKIAVFKEISELHFHCAIHMPGGVVFQMANMHVFGYAEPTNDNLAKRSVSPSLKKSASNGNYPTVSLIKLALGSDDSEFLKMTFGTSGQPDLISMSSCLWDLNEHHGLHDEYYHPFLPISYYQGAKTVSHLISKLAPDSKLISATCKPLNQLDSAKAKAGHTRNRDAQTALDTIFDLVMEQSDNVIQRNVNMGLMLTGFEHLAKDGRHYRGSGAITIVNAYLNAFEETMFPSTNSFLITLNDSTSVKNLVAYVNATFLI